MYCMEKVELHELVIGRPPDYEPAEAPWNWLGKRRETAGRFKGDAVPFIEVFKS
jgi:hypothetical protein